MRAKVQSWAQGQRERFPRPVTAYLDVILQSRVMSLASSTAFWITFTLPWLALGLVSSVGLIAARINPGAVQQAQQAVMTAASRVLTPEAAQQFVEPLLQQFTTGHVEFGVIGALVALWSGSKMVASFTESIAVVYGAPQKAGYARNRGLGLLIYTVALLAAAIAMGVMVVGPEHMMPGGFSLLADILIGGVVLGLLVFMFQAAAPSRGAMLLDLVGAAVALAGWLLGSVGLHVYLAHLFSGLSVYSAVAAPIAILLWSYVTAVAVLLGAAVTVTLRQLAGEPMLP